MTRCWVCNEEFGVDGVHICANTPFKIKPTMTKVTIDRALVVQALEAIELNWRTDKGDAVKPLLRAALAEPAVEPVVTLCVKREESKLTLQYKGEETALDLPDGEYKLYTSPQAQQPAEPAVEQQKTGKEYVDRLIESLLLPMGAMSASDVAELHHRCAQMLLLYASPPPPEPAVEPVGWQPIETAPKDSSSILIYTPDSRWKVREVWWAIPYEGATDGYWSTPVSPMGRGYTILPSAATHWMPLPPAPGETPPPAEPAKQPTIQHLPADDTEGGAL